MSGDKPRDKPRQPEPDHRQELLDEALEESFPASDPVSLVEPGGGITGPEEANRTQEAHVNVDVQQHSGKAMRKKPKSD